MILIQTILHFFLILSIASPCNSQAHEHSLNYSAANLELDCTTLLKNLINEIQETGLTNRNYGNYDSWIRTPTIRTVKFKNGNHGGQLIQIELIGDTWFSDHRTVKYDPQGDPRMFIEVVGGDMADFFGFKMIDAKNMFIPDYQEFMAALTKINKALEQKGEQKLSIQFYQTSDNENVSVSTYVNKFLLMQAIPMAPSGNHLLHDISFHSGGIFLPQEIIDFKKKKLLYEFQFFAELKKIYDNQPEELKAVKYFEYLNNFRNTVEIDNGTAGVNTSITDFNVHSHQLRGDGDREKFFEQFKSDFTGGTRNPYIDLLNFFQITEYKQQSNIDEQIDPAKVSKHLSFISVKQFEKHLTKFSANYDIEMHKFNPHLTYEAQTTSRIGGMCETINGKRMYVRNVIKELKAAEPKKWARP